ncbi:MAG: hypothetical protein M3083_04870 [Actinomycetota bacterium]|nr:hypothetical protein [Actinomycetota bacterium]
MVGTSVEAAVEGWIAELGDGLSLSSSAVQDRLLDIWGMLDEGEFRREIERWLTETLDRNLYTSDDLVVRLRGLGGLESVNS